MHSVILAIATRYLTPLILVFSIILLFRGHNNPGGGFIGGLLAASGFVLHTIAFEVSSARKKLIIDPRTLIGIGLLISLISALISLFMGKQFMTGNWWVAELPLLGKLHIGTPLFFDIGVYLVVVGVTLTIIFALSEE
ncbi:MAG: Na+/H+ antiporter subunit B [Candidatus Anammoxibacter sp.]